jgi:hypothetical protein
MEGERVTNLDKLKAALRTLLAEYSQFQRIAWKRTVLHTVRDSGVYPDAPDREHAGWAIGERLCDYMALTRSGRARALTYIDSLREPIRVVAHAEQHVERALSELNAAFEALSPMSPAAREAYLDAVASVVLFGEQCGNVATGEGE